MASFYSCRINKNNTEVTNIEFEYLDIIIRNNSDTVYYFNKTDIVLESTDFNRREFNEKNQF